MIGHNDKTLSRVTLATYCRLAGHLLSDIKFKVTSTSSTLYLSSPVCDTIP